ncbi:GerAB/ArcD/ProY family transporter [Paenibacillus sediminis]|uniref:Uncharacterized protein n=1 Tax=Paenibacillus sediminis TaxID=664909 RepID=A0ABS4H149_9BACL|nr:GerAB/ArcD/ProY family transporter [Paenibacillus sediminis]MBP1936258.1 hypothetical protein [Paenibacillus sediminis]
MSAFSLFEKKSTFGSVYVILIVNRLQLLYFLFITPMFLVQPYMIWAIIAVGILSQLNLVLLSKWFTSNFAAMGYQGFVKLLGERTVRFFAFIGLFPILIKIVVTTLHYVGTISQFIFPSMKISWLIFFVFGISCFVASHGMENTIRFVVIAYLCVFWMILLFFYPFFTPPIAALHDLYPLIPTEWSLHSWYALLFLWSAFSGPEYLICLTPWLDNNQKMLKYLTIGNILTLLEYLIVFIASLFFFGSNYLSKTNYPVVNMVRFLQSPIFERIDIILISVDLFHFVFNIAILLLFFYGATRISLKRLEKQTTPIGLISIYVAIFVFMFILQKWFWRPGTSDINIWVTIEMWSGAFTYLLVPAFLMIAIRRKGRVQ